MLNDKLTLVALIIIVLLLIWFLGDKKEHLTNCETDRQLCQTECDKKHPSRGRWRNPDGVKCKGGCSTKYNDCVKNVNVPIQSDPCNDCLRKCGGLNQLCIQQCKSICDANNQNTYTDRLQRSTIGSPNM